MIHAGVQTDLVEDRDSLGHGLLVQLLHLVAHVTGGDHVGSFGDAALRHQVVHVRREDGNDDVGVGHQVVQQRRVVVRVEVGALDAREFRG